MSADRKGFGEADQRYIPQILNGLRNVSDSQVAVIRGLSLPNIAYLFTEAPQLELSEPAKQLLFERMPEGISDEQLVKFILISNTNKGSLIKIEREKIEKYFASHPLFFTKPLAGIASMQRLICCCYRRDTAIDLDNAELLRKILDKLINLQNDQKEEKEEKKAEAPATKLLDEACTQATFSLMSAIYRKTETEKSWHTIPSLFFRLVSDQVLSKFVKINDFYGVFSCLQMPLCDRSFALFERVLQFSPTLRDSLFTEQNFMRAFNLGGKPIPENIARIVNLLFFYRVLSPFLLVDWMNRHPAPVREQQEPRSIFLDDIKKYIENPAESIKSQPDQFIAFVRIHLVDNKTTLDLDRWSKLIAAAMAVCDDRDAKQVKHKMTLLMMLVRSLQENHYAKAQRLLHLHLKPRYFAHLSADDHLFIGKAFTTGYCDVKEWPDDKVLLALAFVINRYSLFCNGLVHLEKSANKEAKEMLVIFSPLQPSAKAHAGKLKSLGWNTLCEILSRFAELRGAEETLLEIAAFKYRFEINIENPEEQMLLIEDMLGVVKSKREQLRVSSMQIQTMPAVVQVGHFSKQKKPDSLLHVLEDIEAFLKKMNEQLQPKEAAAMVRA